MKESPYLGVPVESWLETTQELLDTYPLDMDELVKVVHSSWEDIFQSKIGKGSFVIGREILPEPQIMGFLLHQLIPLNLARMYPRK